MIQITPILGIRIAQFFLSILVLGLTGHSIASFNEGNPDSSPSSMNFLIFCAIWTWLTLAYLILSPLFFPAFTHKYGNLACEAVNLIFWFAGFVAVAVYVGDHTITCPPSVCGSIKASIAFSCFSWLAWVASTVLVSLSIFRKTNIGGAMPLMGGHGGHHQGIGSMGPIGGTGSIGPEGHQPLTQHAVDTGYGGHYAPTPKPMGFNPSETPQPYDNTVSPLAYDPHLGTNTPAHLQAQHTGVSSVSALSSGPYAGAGGYSAQISSGGAQGYGGQSPYDPHYSQHGPAEMPAK